VTLGYDLLGAASAQALLLGNSLGTTSALWDLQVAALEPDFRIVRYDHPGHGSSPATDGPVTIESLAESVLELLDRLELPKVSVCGLSLGGAVGMALALAAPERVDRLVLCCTAARFGEPEGWHERARIVRADGTGAIAERVLGRWFTERFREEQPAAVTGFREMLESVSSEGYAACCEAIARWDARDTLGAIRAPTLVIAGAHDVATPPADAEYLSASIPGARLVVLPDAAHLANVEQPDLFTRTLLGFLASERNSEEAA
jgi:3-oxoadipate enol-lactonase